MARAVAVLLYEIVVAGLYAGGVVGVFLTQFGTRLDFAKLNLQIPWWAPVAAPPAFYLLVALLASFPRFTLGRYLTRFFGLVGFHGGLVFATGYLVTAVSPKTPFEAAVSLMLWDLPLASVIELIATPLALAPFRSLMAPRTEPRWRQQAPARQKPAPRRAAAPRPIPRAPVPPAPIPPPAPRREPRPEPAAPRFIEPPRPAPAVMPPPVKAAPPPPPMPAAAAAASQDPHAVVRIPI